MGTEFVAAHVWRVVNHALLASRLPLLNSFVPNLVWLPSQIAKLTDREEGVVQATFQSMAFAVYRHAPVAPHLEDVVEEAWALIPEPVPLTKPVSDLNWFESTERFFTNRLQALESVVFALRTLSAGNPLLSKVVTSRYTSGLPNVALEARRQLLAHLARFQNDGADRTAPADLAESSNS